MNILFTAQFLPAYTASRFASALEDAFELSPSAFRIVYTVPYQPVSGFAQFYFDPTTAGYAAAAEIAHRLYAQSTGTLLAFFEIEALSGQPMLPPAPTDMTTIPMNFTTVPANFTTTFAPAPTNNTVAPSNGTNYTTPSTTTGTAPSSTTAASPIIPTIDPSMNILFTAQFLPAYTASRFASALEDAFELSPSAFRIVYTVPYQPASGFAQFYFDPTTAGYAAAAEIAHRLYAQSTGTLLAFFEVEALSGQPMLPPAPTDMTTIPMNFTTVPANFTTTFAPAPTNNTVAPSNGTNYTTPSTTTGTAPSSTTAAPPIPTIDPSMNILFTAQFLPAYTASRFASALEDAFELSPSAFRIVYTVPYQPASGFAQFYFDPTTAGYAAAAEIAHRLYAQSTGTLLAFFEVEALSGQPMLPPAPTDMTTIPMNFTTVPANFTTTFAPAPTNNTVAPSNGTNYTTPSTTTGTAPSSTTAAPPIPTIDPSMNILFNAQFLPAYTASRFASALEDAFELSPSAFRIVYTVPYQPASGFAQFYFDPTTAGYAAAADIAHRLYAQSTGTLLAFFEVEALSGQPMLPPAPTDMTTIPMNFTTVPANFTTTFAPAPTNYTVAPSNGTNNTTPSTTTGTAPSSTTAAPPIIPTIDPSMNILFTAQFLPAYTASRFASALEDAFELSPSAFRIVYTVPYQPASGFAQFYFDPTTAGYAAAAEIAHRLYAQSTGTLLAFFDIEALSGQPMLPPAPTDMTTIPMNFTTVPANFTTTFAPAPTNNTVAPSNGTNNTTPSTTTGTAPSSTTAAPPIPTIDPSMNILFTAQFLPAYTASRFASALEDAFELSPSAFRIVYTVPYQPASGFAQFYFDPTTAGYAAAAEIAHRLYAQSTGTLLAFFEIEALSGQPMLPPAPTDMTTIPMNFTTVPANFTTTFAPAPTNNTVAPSNGTNYTTPSTTTGTAPSSTTAAPPIPTIDPSMNILFTAQFLPAYTASRFASALEDAFELSPSAFRIVYTVPYQPASGFAQFYFDPTTAGYAAAAEIAHRLYAQSTGTLLAFFEIEALSGQPMLPPAPTDMTTIPMNFTTVPANFTTTFAPAPTNNTVAPSNGTNNTTPSTTTGTAPSSTTAAPPIPTIDPSMNILFTAQFLPAYTASRFASALEDAFELSPSAFRIVYTVPYQPASGFAQFYFDPTTAGYAAAADIAHRLYAQSTGTLLAFFEIEALSGQPMLPPAPTDMTTIPMNFTTVPANFTTTFAPAPTNYTVAPSNGTNYTTPSTTTGTAPSSTTAAPPIPTIDPSMNILFTAQFLPAYTASRFASALEDAFELSPSAFRIVYTVPYQPASGFAQFYFDPTTAGYAAAAEIAHRLYAQSTGTLLAFFEIEALSGQPMLPPAPTDMTTIPMNFTTVPANFTTTFAPAPTNNTVAPSNGTNNTTPSTTTGTAPSSTTAAPPIPTIDPSMNILFTAQFLPAYTASRFASALEDAFELSPSAFRIVYTVPYQPASGFAQFYFDPTTAGYAAAAEIAHRLYTQSTGTLLAFFEIEALSGQPMLPPAPTDMTTIPMNFTTVPANFTTTFAPAPTNNTVAPSNGTNYTTPSTTTGTAPSSTTAAPPTPTIDPYYYTTPSTTGGATPTTPVPPSSTLDSSVNLVFTCEVDAATFDLATFRAANRGLAR
jgi:hypothetical protein